MHFMVSGTGWGGIRMTADLKAPGAVYLNISEDVNDPLHYESYYARMSKRVFVQSFIFEVNKYASFVG